MFGFLRHCRNDPEYKCAYRRCCQFQHIQYGVPSLMLLSYESVFMYQFGIDCGLVAPITSANEAASLTNQRCCRLQASRRMLGDQDAWLAQFATSFGVLLGKIKIDDDIRDGNRISARLAGRALRKSHQKAMSYFCALDPMFEERVSLFIGNHHLLEKPGTTHPIETYAAPTGEAFAYLFELLAVANEIRGQSIQGFRELAANIGDRIGRAIIAFDCAADFKRDQKNGDYNPLKNGTDVGESLAYSSECLGNAQTQIASINHGKSACLTTCQRILAGRARTISSCMGQVSTCFTSSPGDSETDSSSIAELANNANKRKNEDRRWYDSCDFACGDCCSSCTCGPERLACESLNCCDGGNLGDCCSGADCCSGCDCGC